MAVINWDRAVQEGWLLNTDWEPNFYMVGIERVDDPPAWEHPKLDYTEPKFANDDEALLHVLKQALIGDVLALAALKAIHNADMKRFRRCKYCGVTEPREGVGPLGLSKIAEHLEACSDCINAALREIHP